MRTLRIFISSPGDVAEERQIAGKVIERLQGKYWSFVRLDDVFWEEKLVRSTAHYQDELASPGDCEIVFGILWSRLGSPLPGKFLKQTGERYQSGTEWELETAFEAYDQALARTGNPVAAKPDIVIYRRNRPRPRHDDPAQEAEAAGQTAKLETYLHRNYWFPDGTIKRPVTGYSSLEEFEKKLSLDLEELILRQIPSLKPGFEPPPISGSPFKGLQAFDFADSDRYFGRNREIREIQQSLIANARKGLPFLLLYGGSGYGKSSLMRAGLAPILTRPGGSLDHIRGWRRLPFQPAKGEGTLCERLARAFLQPPSPEEAGQSRNHDHWPLTGLPEIANQRAEDDPWDSASLARHFSDDERRVFAIAAIVRTLESLDLHLFLEIDQLEEIFTHPGFDDIQCSAFLRTVIDLCLGGRVWTVATMRSEFFPRVAEQPELFELVGKDRGYTLPPPDRQSLREIIRYPALAARLDFERRIHDIEIAGEKAKHDCLHDQILADAENSPDALPLLEFTLQQLYEERSDHLLVWSSYAKVGGLKGAIAQRATEVYRSLNPVAKEARHRIFAGLVHIDPSRGAVTRRRAPLTALKDHPGSEAFLQAFLDTHLLVTDEDDWAKEPVVTLAHEALITHWDEFSSWIKDHQGDLLARQRLAEQTQLWIENDKKRSYLLAEARLAEAERVGENPMFAMTSGEVEFIGASKRRSKRKQRLLQGAVVTFALLALIAASLGSVAKMQSNEAALQRNRAEQEKQIATETADTLSDTLGLNLFRQGNALLQDPYRSHEGLAFLARAVGQHRNRPAATRLLTFFQQRAIWLVDELGETSSPSDVPPPALPRGFQPPGKTLGAEPGKVGLVAKGPKGLTAVSWQEDTDDENGSMHSGSGLQHFRVWDAGGLPVCDWIEADPDPDTTIDQWIGDISSMHFSPDGEYLAVCVWVWREPAFLQVWHLKSGTKIGADLRATGKVPIYQGASFTDVQFVEIPRSGHGPKILDLIAGTSRGDVYWMQLGGDSEAPEKASLWQHALISHGTPITALALGKAQDSLQLLSASQDGLLKSSSDDSYDMSEIFRSTAEIPPLKFAAPVEKILPGEDQTFQVVSGGKNHRLSLHLPLKLGAREHTPPEPEWLSSLEDEHRVLIHARGDQSRLLFRKDSEEPVEAIDIAADSGSFSIKLKSGKIELYAITDNQARLVAESSADGLLIRHPDHGSHSLGEVIQLRLDANTETLLVLTGDYSYRLFDLQTGQLSGQSMNEALLFQQGGAATEPGDFALSPSGEVLLSRSRHWNPPNSMITWSTLWDCASGEPLSDRSVHFAYDGLEPIHIDHHQAVIGSMEDYSRLIYRPDPSLYPILEQLSESVARSRLDSSGQMSMMERSSEEVLHLVNRLRKTVASSNSLSDRTGP